VGLGDFPNATGPSVYRILPVDFSQPQQLLSQLKQRLENLHSSQRDYVFAQLLDEVSCLFIVLLVASGAIQ